ncbi:MAG: pilus assembly protein [Gammaproteobacteria bacterium]
MNAGSNRIAHVLAGIVLGLSSGSAALADDTELFVANASPIVTGAQPNILFIMDTSGSMDDPVLTQAAWDPNTTFSGCYDEDAIYFSTTGTKPGCSSNNYFWKSRLECDKAAGSLAGLGQYQDEFQAWRNRSGTSNDRWVDLNGNRKNRRAECKGDRGVHGDGGTGTWAADGANGPWSTNSSDEISWNQDYTIYDGNWLNWNATGGSVSVRKIDVLKNVSETLLNNVSGVNIGLMRFNRNEFSNQSGGPVIYPMTNVDTDRANMITTINALPASGWTPLSETLYEAQQYFAGRAVDMGNLNPPVLSVAGSRTGNTMTSNTYDAPVNFSCQKNYVVLITDGLPTRDTDTNGKITSLPQFGSLVGGCNGSGHGACLDDLAEYMFEYDFDSTLPGLQNVTTYTVGFDVNFALLQDTATRGGGEYRIADDAASLATQLTEIVLSILDDATTFTAPAVPVNAFNRIRNLDDVFVSLFEPSGHAHWPGNLKKYKLKGGQLVGQDLVPAVDESTGFFAAGAYSYWSAAPDGDQVRMGGAAHEQPLYTSRKLYTNIAGNNIASAANAIDTSNNPGVTDVMLGSLPGERDTVLNWARGLDVNDEDDDGLTNDTRNVMGDPLHVRPVTIIYGGTEANPDSTVYLSTNDGYMHAINAADGSELWAFVPSRLLPRLYENYLDPLTPNKRYGLDGDIRAVVLNDDFVPGISGSEKVILLFGMRRGGNAMFAMDVTDRNNPKILWEIDGNDADFADMGQTWSVANVVKISVGGTLKHVAVFGGGYDAGQDSPGYRTDAVGNAVYMVDVETGARLWSAGKDSSGQAHDLLLPKMEHSIPSEINVFDMTGNGLADRMYVGDMGGRVWRFDIVNGNGPASLVEGGVIAELGGGGNGIPAAADIRRFYAKPDIVATFPEEHAPYLSINIGSGHRAHPLDAVTDDEFYSIRDFNVFDVVDSGDYDGTVITAVKQGDLLDITNDTAPVMLPSEKGWRLTLNAASGEKVLTSSTTLRGTTFFTSFAPGGAANACTAALGSNRVYRVDILDGSPDPHPDEEDPAGSYTPDDRFKVTNQGGIAPAPTFFIIDNPDDPNDDDGDGNRCVGVDCDDPVVCIGPWCFPSGISNPYERTFWFQDETQ